MEGGKQPENAINYYTIERVDVETGECLEKAEAKKHYDLINKIFIKYKHYKDVNGNTKCTRWYWEYHYRRKPQLTLF